MDGEHTVLSEHEEQRDFVSQWRQRRPERIFAVPNGGRRSRTEAMRLKLEGVSAGVPDLFIPALRLWVEMKREKGGVVSQDQRDWISYLLSIGDRVIVARGCADAWRQIEAMQ